MQHEHVRIAVTDTDNPGFERVPARRVNDTEWQLLTSPLYAMNVAAGDTVKVIDGETGAYEIVARGGNVCVQFYLSERQMNEPDFGADLAAAIETDLADVDGWIDGHAPGLIAFTIPVRSGFATIERICASAMARCDDAEWQYSNVYDPVTGDLLGWWE